MLFFNSKRFKMQVMQHAAMTYRLLVCLAMNFISRNLDRKLSLEKIAGAAYFSMFHLHRIFKATASEKCQSLIYLMCTITA